MLWPQPSYPACMCSVPWSTCKLHINSMQKRWTFTILKHGEERNNHRNLIQLDRYGYVRLWYFVRQMWIRLSKCRSYFGFRMSFQRFSLGVARCYNGWNLNTRILRDAWWTGLAISALHSKWRAMDHLLPVTGYKIPGYIVFCPNIFLDKNKAHLQSFKIPGMSGGKNNYSFFKANTRLGNMQGPGANLPMARSRLPLVLIQNYAKKNWPEAQNCKKSPLWHAYKLFPSLANTYIKPIVFSWIWCY